MAKRIPNSEEIVRPWIRRIKLEDDSDCSSKSKTNFDFDSQALNKNIEFNDPLDNFLLQYKKDSFGDRNDHESNINNVCKNLNNQFDKKYDKPKKSLLLSDKLFTPSKLNNIYNSQSRNPQDLAILNSNVSATSSHRKGLLNLKAVRQGMNTVRQNMTFIDCVTSSNFKPLPEKENTEKEIYHFKNEINNLALDRSRLEMENQKLQEQLDKIKNEKNINSPSKINSPENKENLNKQEDNSIKDKDSESEKKLIENQFLLKELEDKETLIKEMSAKLNTLKECLKKEEESKECLFEMIQEMRGNLKLYCRIKPPSNSDCKILESTSDKKMINLFKTEKDDKNAIDRYYFDKVFDVDSTQDELFQEIAISLPKILSGKSCCILAYGQTASGKTYTIEGYNNPGVLQNSIKYLLSLKDKETKVDISEKTVETSFSIIEVYNENITDLLDPNNKISIMSENGNDVIPNATQISIDSYESFTSHLEKASKLRTSAKTIYNMRSSRSHCIYIFRLKRDKITGSLYIVDLAGSERCSFKSIDFSKKSAKELEEIKKIQAEAGHINKSLTTLGRAIRILSEKSNIMKVPFRETKLTRVLKECFNGSGHVSLIINISSDKENYRQTKESLQFGAKLTL